MVSELTPKEKVLLFWASFLALTAAGFGFAFRVAKMGEYGKELELTNVQVGMIFGATLWPIAITMILFSLVVDRTGYKIPMFIAFALQTIGGVGTAMSGSYGMLYVTALAAGLGHGIVEAVINPCCAAVYPKEKTKMLTILHAAWPAGLVGGTLMVLMADAAIADLSWKVHAMWMVIPAVAYVLMYLPCRFPVDPRIRAGVPYIEMLRQVGFLGGFLASFMLIYEFGNQSAALGLTTLGGTSWFYTALGLGVVAGGIFGFAVKAVGQPLFFLMCVLMIPLATTELGTDQWIRKLMEPVLANPSWAIVISAGVMLVLRTVAAGPILKIFSPPALLCVSGAFSAIGLFWLSAVDVGALVFVAFVIYAMGQTYYWPCVLGFVSERYPRGGALTLNTVSALGLLSVGIVGGQLLGLAFDKTEHGGMKEKLPEITAKVEDNKSLFGIQYTAIMPEEINKCIVELKKTDPPKAKLVEETYATVQGSAGRGVLKFAAFFPLILFFAFGCIFLYFKSQGGYKPIELATSSGGGGDIPPAGGVPPPPADPSGGGGAST